MTTATRGGSEQHDRPGLRARLREDFDFAIMFSIGGFAALVIAGFAVYRFGSGNPIGGIVNCIIVVALCSVLAYGWRSGNTARTGTLFVLLASAACVTSSIVFGRTGAFWAYLVLWMNFTLARREIALALNLILTGILAANATLFDSGAERAVYVVSALMVTAFAWILSSRYAQQRRQLEYLATIDPLTNTGNRRLLQRDLERAVTAMRERRTPSVLAVLDLDHFKHVNDSRGHEAGDQVLVRLAGIVRARIRSSDGIYRFGGEEFVVLMPQARIDAMRPTLGDLHARLNTGLGEIAGSITVSIGAAELLPGENWSTWLGRADAALYRAKQGGRNRVVVAGDHTCASPDRRNAQIE